MYDFIYDGIRLSSFNCMIVSFNGLSSNDISNGAKITFNTTTVRHGQKYLLTSTQYDETLTATISIGKKCGETLSMDEVRMLSKWLGRNKFLELEFLDDQLEGYKFNASFNTSMVVYGTDIIGMNLEMTTDSPFAYLDEKVIIQTITSTDDVMMINNLSDTLDPIDMKMKITCGGDGDLIITNTTENRSTILNGCTSGEIITFDYPVISSDSTTHAIMDNFNFNFPRLINSNFDDLNQFTFTLNPTVEVTYTPLVKVGVIYGN